MAISFVAASGATHAVASTSISPAKPTGIATGDFMVAKILRRTSGAVTAPAGWTRVGTQITQALNGWADCFVKEYEGEAGPYQFTYPSTTHAAITILAFRPDSGNTLSVLASAQLGDDVSDLNVNVPAITMASDTVMLVACIGILRGNTSMGMGSSGYTPTTEFDNASNSGAIAQGAYKTYTGANPPAQVFTCPNSVRNTAFHLALGQGANARPFSQAIIIG